MNTAAHKQAAKAKPFAVAPMMDKKDNTIKSIGYKPSRALRRKEE
jgi:hypothetical protein